MKGVTICLGTDLKSNESMGRSAFGRFTAVNEIWSWSTDSIFYYVGHESSEEEAYEETKDRYVGFVGGGSGQDDP
jgi:hypothetical protein